MTTSSPPPTIQTETRNVEQLGFAPWVRVTRTIDEFQAKAPVMERWLHRFAARRGYVAGRCRLVAFPFNRMSPDPLLQPTRRNGREEWQYGGVKCYAVKDAPPGQEEKLAELLSGDFSSRTVHFRRFEPLHGGGHE